MHLCHGIEFHQVGVDGCWIIRVSRGWIGSHGRLNDWRIWLVIHIGHFVLWLMLSWVLLDRR